MRPAIKRLAALPVAAAATAVLVGCGLPAGFGGPTATTPARETTVVVADISGSTRGRRDAYLADAMTAVTATADLDGSLYLSTVDGLATDESWPIAAKRFTGSVGGGNAELARAARRHRAERLRGRVTRLLHAHGQGGTDLLAMLGNVRRLLCSLPDVPDRRLVLITDGAIVAGGVNLYRHPPRTPRARAALVSRLRRSGEIPADLGCGGPVRVWLSQLGAGVGSRATAIAVRRFFVDVVRATGGVVAADEPQLLPDSFPLSFSSTHDASGGAS